ncbi:hypothetical protein CBL_02863 [Carabus blaptoides fortunei]
MFDSDASESDPYATDSDSDYLPDEDTDNKNESAYVESEDASSSENDETIQPLRKKAKMNPASTSTSNVTLAKKKRECKSKCLCGIKEIPHNRQVDILGNLARDSRPFDVFFKLFPKNLFKHIDHCTNKKLEKLQKEQKRQGTKHNYKQKPRKISKTDPGEIMVVIGCTMIMAYNRVPALPMYWPQNVSLGNATIKNAISREPEKPEGAISGYVYDLNIYAGKDVDANPDITGTLGEKVVKKLCSTIRDKEVSICCDRFFTSVDLLRTLDFACVGTCIQTRRNLPNFNQKLERGESTTLCNNFGTIATKWQDTKAVLVLSNCHSDIITEVNRTAKDGSKKKLLVNLAEQLVGHGKEQANIQRKCSSGRPSEKIKKMFDVRDHLPVDGNKRRRCLSCVKKKLFYCWDDCVPTKILMGQINPEEDCEDQAAHDTQGQYKSPLWFELRYARITASKAYEVANYKTASGALVDLIMGASKILRHML